MSTPQPRILSVMGDFTDPLTLIRVMRCSKTAKLHIKPILDLKMTSAWDMRNMVIRIFPTIQYLPHPLTFTEKDAAAKSYLRLVRRFFSATARHEVQISHSVGSMLDKSGVMEIDEILPFFDKEMRSAKGRRLILESIRVWRQVEWPNPHSWDSTRRLDLLEQHVLEDFAIPLDVIDSRYGRWRK